MAHTSASQSARDIWGSGLARCSWRRGPSVALPAPPPPPLAGGAPVPRAPTEVAPALRGGQHRPLRVAVRNGPRPGPGLSRAMLAGVAAPTVTAAHGLAGAGGWVQFELSFMRQTVCMPGCFLLSENQSVIFDPPDGPSPTRVKQPPLLNDDIPEGICSSI